MTRSRPAERGPGRFAFGLYPGLMIGSRRAGRGRARLAPGALHVQSDGLRRRAGGADDGGLPRALRDPARPADRANRAGAPRDEPQDAALTLARRIAEKPRFALQQVKKAVNGVIDAQGRETSMNNAFDLHQLAHVHNLKAFWYAKIPDVVGRRFQLRLGDLDPALMFEGIELIVGGRVLVRPSGGASHH
jgi:hypothetical protein